MEYLSKRAQIRPVCVCVTEMCLPRGLLHDNQQKSNDSVHHRTVTVVGFIVIYALHCTLVCTVQCSVHCAPHLRAYSCHCVNVMHRQLLSVNTGFSSLREVVTVYKTVYKWSAEYMHHVQCVSDDAEQCDIVTC